jgi:hypothetical protein
VRSYNTLDNTRAGRGPLALLISALGTIAGFGDEHRITTSSVRPTRRSVSRGTRSHETAALATATITIDREADVYFEGITGTIVRGTVECSRPVTQPLRLAVTAHQKGPHGTIVRGYHEVPVVYSASPQPWAILIAPSLGGESFKYGKARVAVAMLGTPGELLPATTSRSVRFVPGIF